MGGTWHGLWWIAGAWALLLGVGIGTFLLAAVFALRNGEWLNAYAIAVLTSLFALIAATAMLASDKAWRAWLTVLVAALQIVVAVAACAAWALFMIFALSPYK